MFKMKLSVPDLRSRLLDIPPRAQRQFRRELQTTVKPAVQRDVDVIIAPPPGPVQHPFVFHIDPDENARIRAAFFATKGFGRGLGAPRSGQMEDSWAVLISSQIRTDLIVVKNLKPASIYVFPGPHQLPGHKKTGWGRDFDRKFAEVERRARYYVAQAWLRSVQSAVRTK
jgi:hypothetical protein